MKQSEAADVVRVIAQHLETGVSDEAVAAYARALEGLDRRDLGVAVERWMAAHRAGDPFPTIPALQELAKTAENERWGRSSSSTVLAGAAGAAPPDIAHDTAELVRRRCLPPTDADHLTLDAFVLEMATLNAKYPAARWGMAAAELSASVKRDRAAQAANAANRDRLGHKRWTDEEAA